MDKVRSGPVLLFDEDGHGGMGLLGIAEHPKGTQVFREESLGCELVKS